jgi:uncharacterized membrane protein YuzA (DUF378 family)
MRGKSRIAWLILGLAAAVIKIFSFFPVAVERYYATGIYPVIVRLLRLLFGWIPFSVGDVFYTVAGIALLLKLVSFMRDLFRKKITRKFLLGSITSVIFWLLALYVSFNILWGLNYNRLGIANQLQLKVKPYSTAELSSVVDLIIDRLNTLDSASLLHRDSLKNNRALFGGATGAYATLAGYNPIFAYPSPSVKPSLFSYLGDYLGFTGYYNPFSGEAQVNTTVPVFVLPFTTCHEIGHQLGYAKENEANIAGYLSAKSSADPAFKYSVYFDLYYYAAGELFVRDSNLLKPLKARLSPAVRQDYRDLQRFYMQYQNPFEPIIRKLYGKYLRANQQPQGLMSYNEVIAWLIAYYNKYGATAI